jgi:hypothetical protein
MRLERSLVITVVVVWVVAVAIAGYRFLPELIETRPDSFFTKLQTRLDSTPPHRQNLYLMLVGMILTGGYILTGVGIATSIVVLSMRHASTGRPMHLNPTKIVLAVVFGPLVFPWILLLRGQVVKPPLHGEGVRA